MASAGSFGTCLGFLGALAAGVCAFRAGVLEFRTREGPACELRRLFCLLWQFLS